MSDWEFRREEDGSLTIESAVFQALGAASVCWDEIEKAGVFEDARAKEVGEALVQHINKEMDGPRLGCATTKELIEELACRLELDHFCEGATVENAIQAGLVSRILKKFLDGEFALSERQLKYRTVDS